MSDTTSPVERTLKGRQLKFSLADKPPLPNLCDLAREFYADCAALLDTVQQDKRELTVNVTLLQLQHKYFGYYASAPLAHRKHDGGRRNNPHHCLGDVYHYYYAAINRIRLELNPPLLRETAPASTPVAQIPALYLGDVEG